jgi:hypothetical protein
VLQQRIRVTAGRFAQGKILKEMISEKTWNRLDSLAGEWKSLFPDLLHLDHGGGDAVSAIAVQKAGILPEWGLITCFWIGLRNRARLILGLETPADQIAYFQRSLIVLDQFIGKDLDEAAKIDSMVFSITRAWKCGDIPVCGVY